MQNIKLIEQNGFFYPASYWENYEVKDDDFNKIISGNFLIKLDNNIFSFIENKELIDDNIKQILILEYKQTMSEIKDLTFEINEIEETKHYLPEEEKEVANERLEFLISERTLKRNKIKEITNEGLTKFWPEVIKEF